MTISKLWDSWKHFGTKMMLSKAWERFVVDEYRFRDGVDRAIPQFTRLPTASLPNERTHKKHLSICYFIHCFYPDKLGGTERFTLSLAHEQKRLGNEVRVITLGKRFTGKYEHRFGSLLYTEFEYDGIPVTQIRYMRAPKGLYYDVIDSDEPQMRAFTEHLIDRYQIDFAHFVYPQPFAPVAAVLRRHHIPYGVTLTDFNIVCHYATLVCKNGSFCTGSEQGRKCAKICKTYALEDSQKRFQAGYAFLKEAAFITMPSQFVANVMGAEFPKCRLSVVPHGISGSFHCESRRMVTRKYAFVGTLSPLKGVHILIEAFKKLTGDVSLEIYGSGEQSYVNKIKRLAEDDSRISFYGAVQANKMPEVYRGVDCVVVPSVWFETYNFVLREALMCGCLCVAADMGAMPEAIVEGKNGFLFSAGNVASLGEALKEAQRFDWCGYQYSTFPSTEEEGEIYDALYQSSEEKRQ